MCSAPHGQELHQKAARDDRGSIVLKSNLDLPGWVSNQMTISSTTGAASQGGSCGGITWRRELYPEP